MFPEGQEGRYKALKACLSGGDKHLLSLSVIAIPTSVPKGY